jgi:hypothetical protein
MTATEVKLRHEILVNDFKLRQLEMLQKIYSELLERLERGRDDEKNKSKE